jgi:hypothetical protein
MLGVADRLAQRQPAVTVRLLDRHEAVRPETRVAFEALSWKAEALTADVFQGLEEPIMAGCEVIIANLFLHHFTATKLSDLFARIGERAGIFVALEPNRSAIALSLSRCVRMIGCNEITQHDAPVSVHAGFSGNELSRLWPDTSGWRLRECSIGLCSHLFVAQRCETGVPLVDVCRL